MTEYLTREEVQELLKLSDKQVKALFYTEGFPYVSIGTAKRVRADKLDEWLETHEGEKLQLDYTKV